ncbi:hypothetical protein ACF044_10660 [Microbacterium sp. NPDC016588]
MKFETIEHPTQPGLTVEAVHIATEADLVELRKSDWHDGALALLTYPSSVVGYLSHENPKVFGARVEVGSTILKGPGGDFEVIVPVPSEDANA